MNKLTFSAGIFICYNVQIYPLGINNMLFYLTMVCNALISRLFSLATQLPAIYLEACIMYDLQWC